MAKMGNIRLLSGGGETVEVQWREEMTSSGLASAEGLSRRSFDKLTTRQDGQDRTPGGRISCRTKSVALSNPQPVTVSENHSLFTTPPPPSPSAILFECLNSEPEMNPPQSLVSKISRYQNRLRKDHGFTVYDF